MPSLVQLKQEIQFNTGLNGLLNAMKSIAAQQFQSLERKFTSNPAVFEAIETIVGTFDVEHLAHPFTRPEGRAGVILVTSDTGLLGGLNQQVIAAALQEYRRAPGELIVIGERGVAALREYGLACKAFTGIMDSARDAVAAQVRDYALNQMLAGRFALLRIVYPRALSFTLQRVEVIKALPCAEWFRSGTVSRGTRSRTPVLFESTAFSVLEYLVWLWLEEKLAEVLKLSRLAELGARSVHLEGSTQELQSRAKKLQLRYFRQRHEAIDRNMRELFAAKAIFGERE
jgi:ATP synthase F1 gamma subunit